MFLMIGHIHHFETSVTEAYNHIFQPGLKQDQWSCFCLLELPSLLPESSICTNPPAPDDNDFFDKLPMLGGVGQKDGDSKWENEFSPFRLMYMKYTSDTSSALLAGVPAGGHRLSMYSASYQAT